MDAEATAIRNRVGPYVYFGSIYSITVGLLYLWGYWGRFDVNILEYISLADVIKLAAYPIASIFIFVLLGAVTGELLVGNLTFTPGAGRDTRIGRFLQRIAPTIVRLYVVGTLAYLVFGPESKWQIAPILVALPIYLVAKRRHVLLDAIPNESARSVVIYMLAILPMGAYGFGRLDATRLLEGREYRYVTSHLLPGLKVGDPKDAKNRVKYVGHVNDYVFLLLPDNVTLYVVRLEKTGGLQLRTFKASQSPPVQDSNSQFQQVPDPAARGKR